MDDLLIIGTSATTPDFLKKLEHQFSLKHVTRLTNSQDLKFLGKRLRLHRVDSKVQDRMFQAHVKQVVKVDAVDVTLANRSIVVRQDDVEQIEQVEDVLVVEMGEVEVPSVVEVPEATLYGEVERQQVDVIVERPWAIFCNSRLMLMMQMFQAWRWTRNCSFGLR